MQQQHGFPERFKPPSNIDFYVLSNEDIGLIASIVTATINNHQFALPYPASFDIDNESLIVYAIEFMCQVENEIRNAEFNIWMNAFLSMLKKTPTVEFRGQATDTNDEFLKAQFAGSMGFGTKLSQPNATASVEGIQRSQESLQTVLYVPPIPLDLIVPLYVTLINTASTVVLATNVKTDADFASFETVQLRVWFTTRKLNAAEKSFRSMQMRFQRLDS